MKNIVLMIMIFCSFLELAHAQNLFEYDRVDFFNSIGAQEKMKEPQPKEESDTIESEWAEPIINPSGKVTIYVPPKEVRDFLDKPDSSSAKAYLDWNLKRIKKFITAQQLLEKEVKAIGLDKDNKDLVLSPSPYTSDLIDSARFKGKYIFYFMLKGCPACQDETKIIEDIYLNHPEIKIEVFASGFSDEDLNGFAFPVKQDGGMSQHLKINSYPAIFIFNEKKEKYFISGYVDKDKMLELF